MSIQAPEREILNFQPHLFKTIALVSAALFLTRIIFDWKFLIEGHFSKIEFVYKTAHKTGTIKYIIFIKPGLLKVFSFSR